MKLVIKEFYTPKDLEKRFVLMIPLPNGKELYAQPIMEGMQFSTLDEILREIARLDPKDEIKIELTRVNRYRNG